MAGAFLGPRRGGSLAALALQRAPVPNLDLSPQTRCKPSVQGTAGNANTLHAATGSCTEGLEVVNRVLPKYGCSGPLEVSQIWGADYDIDVAATLLNGAQAFGECKWWAGPVGLNILDRLQENSALTRYRKRDHTPCYLLFSRSGFTPELETKAAGDPRVVLIDPEQLLDERVSGEHSPDGVPVARV